MNKELLQLYIAGLSQKALKSSNGQTIKELYENMEMYELELKLGRTMGKFRYENPEFQEARKIFNSPLMKALE